MPQKAQQQELGTRRWLIAGKSNRKHCSATSSSANGKARLSCEAPAEQIISPPCGKRLHSCSALALSEHRAEARAGADGPEGLGA